MSAQVPLTGIGALNPRYQQPHQDADPRLSAPASRSAGSDWRAPAGGHTMKNHGMMPIPANTSTMWTLNEDRKTVRFSLPPLRHGSLPEPLMVFMDLDAGTVDEIVDRLTVLRAQMVPAPPKPASRN